MLENRMVLITVLGIFPAIAGCLGPVGHHISEDAAIGAHLALQSATKQVVVQRVMADSPAARANLKGRDIVMAWNGVRVDGDLESLVEAIKASGHREDSVIQILRDDKSLDITIRPVPNVESWNYLVFQKKRSVEVTAWIVNLGIFAFGRGFDYLGYREDEALFLDLFPEHLVRAAYGYTFAALEGLRGFGDFSVKSLGVEGVEVNFPTITWFPGTSRRINVSVLSFMWGDGIDRIAAGGVYPLANLFAVHDGFVGFVVTPFLSFGTTKGEGPFFDLWPFVWASPDWHAVFPLYTRIENPNTRFTFWKPPALLLKERDTSGRDSWRILWFFHTGS